MLFYDIIKMTLVFHFVSSKWKALAQVGGIRLPNENECRNPAKMVASCRGRREASVTRCCQCGDCAYNEYRSAQAFNSGNTRPSGKIQVGGVTISKAARGRPLQSVKSSIGFYRMIVVSELVTAIGLQALMT